MGIGVNDAQLDASRGVLDVWAGILQRRIMDERLNSSPDAEKIKTLQAEIYSIARQSREFGVMDSPTVNDVVEKYSLLISQARANDAEVL